MECLTCLNIQRVQRISPGPFIFESASWLVDHAYPCLHPGWLVILPRRHIEALHELSRAEFLELAELEYTLLQVMQSDPTIQKEYLMCFAEGPGFQHVHIHLVPRPISLAEEYQGPRIFAMLQTERDQAIPADAITAFCEDFARKLQALEQA